MEKHKLLYVKLIIKRKKKKKKKKTTMLIYHFYTFFKLNYSMPNQETAWVL